MLAGNEWARKEGAQSFCPFAPPLFQHPNNIIQASTQPATDRLPLLSLFLPVSHPQSAIAMGCLRRKDKSGVDGGPRKPQDSGRQFPLDADVRFDGLRYFVANTGAFNHTATYNFDNGTVPSGLRISLETIPDGGAPFNHEFRPECVCVHDGSLDLLVPGGQDIHNQEYRAHSAEVATVEKNFLYASMRTVAIFSKVPGACHGIFFHKSDNCEIDIEYLTDPTSLSNPGSGRPPHMMYTNQPRIAGDRPSQVFGKAPEDVGTAHEYRIDWIPEATLFYVDGHLQAKMHQNVPREPCAFVWNNWCNGAEGWTKGPPTQDCCLKILKITMYYNLAADISVAGLWGTGQE